MHQGSARNAELRLVLSTFWAEYKLRPILNIGFLLSLAIATSTLLSILVLNDASKQQYQTANQKLKPPVSFYVVPAQGSAISLDDFVFLRQSGFHQLNGVQIIETQLKSGKSITIRALDLLPLSVTDPAKFSSVTLNMHREHAKQLGIALNDDIELKTGEKLTLKVHNSSEWKNTPLLDLAVAWITLGQAPEFSYLVSGPMEEAEKASLIRMLPEGLAIREAWSMEERSGFADALHLNLTALAVLGFIVSLFIAFQAANQAWRTRVKLTIQLRLLGVSLKSIWRALFIEATLLTFAATLLGLLLAKLFTYMLLPLLGMTLQQIYSLQSSEQLTWSWLYYLWALIISMVAVLAALTHQITNISSARVALRAKPQVREFNYKVCWRISVGLFLVYVLIPSSSWLLLMLKYGVLLLASVSFLPIFIRFLLANATALTNDFTKRFVFKDAGIQIGRRFLPVAAFYLALTSSIAAALMVKSFESSFVSYLDQILRSDVFISYSKVSDQKTQEWLNNNESVNKFVTFSQTTAKIEKDTLLVYALRSEEQLQGLYLKSGGYSRLNPINKHCYINEQLAIAHSLKIDQSLTFTQAGKEFQCQIIGIYHDYGNQALAIRVIAESQIQALGGWRISGYGVFFKPTLNEPREWVIRELGISEEEVFVPEQVKKLALDVFDQTFILTQAIGFVLLAIACFGLFLSANNLELARKPDLLILSSLGYSKKALFIHMLIQWILIVLLTMALSWPVGIVLANALVTQVLPASFGWSMPLQLGIGPFMYSSLIGLIILLPALAFPLYKLNIRQD